MTFNNKLVILVLSIVFLGSCIDPVSFTNDKKVEVLVVEGGISTLAGPHFVKITRTAKYGDVFAGENKNETDAKIYLRDDLGNVVLYTEVGKGQYKSPDDFSGQVGRTYSLFIETSDGREYISNPETIVAVPKVDSIFYEHKTIPSVDIYGNPSEKKGVEVKVIFKDPGQNNNYYKWTTRGTYKFIAHPELYTPPMSQVPDPKECCTFCWLSEENKTINVVEDKLFQGNEYVHTAFFLEDNGGRFYEKYFLELEQKSISRESYEFYSLLKSQLEINGDIFDAPPTEITGNIISISDPNEVVIGHFGAYDISTASLFIIGIDLPSRNSPPEIRDDCRVVRGATTAQPVYW